MGFVPPTINSTNPAGSTAASGSAQNLPGGLQDGDLLILAVDTSSGVATPPTGFSILGSAVVWATGTSLYDFAIYTKTWHFGDATTFSLTTTGGGGYYFHVSRIHASGTISVQTDSTNHATSTTNTMPHFSPSIADSDLRLMYVLQSSGQGAVPATPAISPNNPSAQPMVKIGASAGVGWGHTSGGAALIWLDTYYGLWADPAGLDANDQANAVVSQGWLSRSICLTDGDDGYSGTKELDLQQGDPGITADTPQGNQTDALNAAKGRFVGGARIL